MKVYRWLFMFILHLICVSCYGQKLLSATDKKRNLETAVPFLLINPDARSGGMGDAGVAVLSDRSSLFNNPSKIVMNDYNNGFAFSYSPLLRSLADDINLLYFSGTHKVNDNSVIGAAIRYLSLGEFELTDDDQQVLEIYTPNELAIDFTYAKKFGSSFSLATSLRYINSGLQYVSSGGNPPLQSGNAIAVDVSTFYNVNMLLFNKSAILSLGANISNIGSKFGSRNNFNKEFLPANLKVGAAGKFVIDDYNTFSIALDLSKLLVPSSPIHDMGGNIIKGKSRDKSVPSAIFGSFSDAPGGLPEELKEINIASGVEYEYNEAFTIRAGYFYQNPLKGLNRYFTTGIGLKYKQCNIDFAYLLGGPESSLLASTLRFSLFFQLR